MRLVRSAVAAAETPVLRDNAGFATEDGGSGQGTARDPGGAAGAVNATQGHPQADDRRIGVGSR